MLAGRRFGREPMGAHAPPWRSALLLLDYGPGLAAGPRPRHRHEGDCPMRRHLALLLLAAALAVTGCSSTGSTVDAAKGMFASDTLVSSLGTLGMSPTQATGSLGSLVSLASNRLSPADFSKFSGYLPNSEKYLKAAEAAGLLKSPVKDVAGLNSNFAALGVEPNVARGFLGEMSQYFTSKGGESARGLFASAISK
jgi:hypothetical protein